MPAQTDRPTRVALDLPSVVHPGPPLADRVLSIPVTIDPSERFVVPEGRDLFRTVHRRLDAIRADGAAFRLIGGMFTDLVIMTGGQGADRPVTFLGPHRLATPARVMAGAAGSGRDESGQRFSHCHAAFTDAEGQQVGGHLLADQAVAGKGGVTVEITPISGGLYVRRPDPESLFDLFHPEAA